MYTLEIRTLTYHNLGQNVHEQNTTKRLVYLLINLIPTVCTCVCIHVHVIIKIDGFYSKKHVHWCPIKKKKKFEYETSTCVVYDYFYWLYVKIDIFVMRYRHWIFEFQLRPYERPNILFYLVWF